MARRPTGSSQTELLAIASLGCETERHRWQKAREKAKSKSGEGLNPSLYLPFAFLLI
jgi:hypothetical protein